MQTPSTPALKLYRHALSGHCHRVELFLSLLGVPVELCDVDLLRGAQKAPDFLRLNAFGQVPVLDDAGTIVADSNAILIYLATKYGAERWLPRDPLGAASVQRWLSVAAGQLASGPGAARLINLFRLKQDRAEPEARAHALLQIMESELAQRAFLAGSEATLADLAAYTYVAHAPEGNVALDAYPRVCAWLARVEALPGFIPMSSTPIGLRVA